MFIFRLMKKRHLLFYLSFLFFLLVLVTGCGHRVIRSHVVATKQIQVSNGRIAFANKIQKDPLSSNQSISVYSEVQLISPASKSAFTLPTPRDDRSNPLYRYLALPIWAPNGKKLMVIAGQEIFITSADGKGSIRIEDYREIIPKAEDFAWSPDSQRLAYEIYGSIVVAQADGSKSVQAADSQLRRINNILIGWSSDGQSLIFVEQAESNNLSLYRLSIPQTLPNENQDWSQSSRQKLATWPIEENGGCQMHPNGQQVACLISQTVKLIEIENGHQSNFLEGTLTKLPVWSPDGHAIAFTTGERLQTLWAMTSDGRQLPRKVAEAAPFLTWQWSPDSQKLLWVEHPKIVNGFWMGQGLFIIDADGKNRHTVVTPGQKGVAISSASWQPLPR
jgi:Tol biopolymer transport system component